MPGNSPAEIAHAALGQVGAYDARDVHLVFLLVDPKWAPYEPMVVSLISEALQAMLDKDQSRR